MSSEVVGINNGVHMPVECPGCREILNLVADQDHVIGTSWGQRAKMIGWQGHDCAVLGPMPDPLDTPALLAWMSGNSGSAPKKGGTLTIVADNSTVNPVSPKAGSAPDQMEQKKTTRRYVHVPFDSTECPVEGCKVFGKVPGVRRHVGFMHKDMVDKVTFPPNRTVEGLLSAFEADEQKAERLIDDLGIRKDLPEGATWEEVAERVLALVGNR